MPRLFLTLVACAAAMLSAIGCNQSAPPEFRFNAVELRKQEMQHLGEGEKFDAKYKSEIGNLVTSLFGTPDDPEFPFLMGEDDPAQDIIKMDYLKMAAGAVNSDKAGPTVGLYREHCAHCHGITGDGAGATASTLNPYPRDFRLGKFKFKSTPLRTPPTDHDLKNILVRGVPGTAMPSFRTLEDDELDSLVHYVKYLTMRGMYERYLIGELAGLEEGQSLVDFSLIASKDGEEPSDDAIEEFEEQLYTFIGEGYQEGIMDRWLDPDRKITEIPPAPAEVDPSHPDHDKLVAQGGKLFFSKGNCAQCHGDTGVGDGQLANFDDWTKEWTNSPGVDPFDKATYKDFVKLGAMDPRPIRPRNLNQGIYRGGDRPDDVYLRIANGIEGTPMPASAAMNSDEIWALVAYVRSIPFEAEVDQNSKVINTQQVAR
ncbi:MAG: cytochrome c [Planctomycetota bacterium]